MAEAPRIGTRAVCATWLALRSEIIQMLEMKQKVDKKRHSTPASSADTRKKATKQKVQ